jgi:hypothetical protein
MDRGSLSRRRLSLSVAAVLGSASLAAVGCQLVLDFSPVSDGGGDVTEGDASSACGTGEPNDELAQASEARSGDPIAGALCGPSDRDFVGFKVDGTQDALAELSFDGARGDLELQLWSVEGETILTVSTGLDNDERIEHSEMLGNRLAAGAYAVEVMGRDETVENGYQLTITLSEPLPDAGAGGM